MKISWRLFLTTIGLAVAVFGAAGQDRSRSVPLIVSLRTANGGVAGTATFRETMTGKLNIDIQVNGLLPGEHAVHIHTNPVCDGGVDFRTSGGHFNPQGKEHGTLNPLGHHAGDLPENVVVTAQPEGNNFKWAGTANFTVNGLSLKPGVANSILGRSIVVHEKEDDMRTDPSGNAGNRLACGVIALPPTR